MLHKLIKRIIPIGIVVAAIAFAMMLVGGRQKLATSEAPGLLPHVQAVEVALGDVPVAIIAHGNVRARHELELASEVTGRVEWVAPEFESGQLVTAGTVLLRVDPTLYRLALAEANAALATAKNALADAKALKRAALVSEGELNIEAASQRIAKAEQDLAYTEIKAPFNAVIDQKLVDLGQYISTGRTVARLLSNDTAEVSLPVSAAEAGLIEESAPVMLSAKIGEQEQQWQARILRIESRVDQQTRVIPVVVEVTAPYDRNAHDYRLPLGLFVEAAITGAPIGAAVRLPLSALQADDTVFVIVDGALRRARVAVAVREGNTVIINGGLQTGDVVVTSRLEVMFEGLKVERTDA